MIAVVMVPLGYGGGRGVRMPAKRGVSMGVSLVPMSGFAKARKGEDDG